MGLVGKRMALVVVLGECSFLFYDVYVSNDFTVFSNNGRQVPSDAQCKLPLAEEAKSDLNAL